MEPVEPIQINIYQSNTYRKNLIWLHYDDESRVQERQQLKDQQSCISILVHCLKGDSLTQRLCTPFEKQVLYFPISRHGETTNFISSVKNSHYVVSKNRIFFSIFSGISVLWEAL